MAGLSPDPSESRRRALVAAALLAAALLAWIVALASKPPDLAPSASGAVGTGAPGAPAGTPGWAPAPGLPLVANAGPPRSLSGDWTLPGPKVDRTLLRPAEERPVPAREPHVIPRAPTRGALQALAPLEAAKPSRSMAPSPAERAAPAPAPAPSSATAVATPPAEAREKPRRTFIPIPEPAARGVREAKQLPVYRTEPTVASTTDGSASPAGIAIDQDQAVALIDRDGDGRLEPLPKGARRAPPPAPQTDPRFIQLEPERSIQAASVKTSSGAARGRPPAPQPVGRPQRSIGQ